MYAMRQARDRKPAESKAAPGRYFDSRFNAEAVKVLPGEFVVASEDLMLVTVLGSCVAACIHDPLARVGGMNHFMLPDVEGADGNSARYGAYAMEMLINDLLKHGAARNRFQAKVFGGGAVLASLSSSNVGERNIAFVRRYLELEGIPILAEDLGDTCPRRVHYFPYGGRAMVRRLPTAQQAEMLASESLYRSKLRQEPTSGDVELFS
jgi:chemotaxis protein CheD